MFDLAYHNNTKRLAEAIRELTASAATSVQILIDKGICTEAEWMATQVRVNAHLDQAIAAKQEEAEARIALMSPVSRMFYEITGEELSPKEE